MSITNKIKVKASKISKDASYVHAIYMKLEKVWNIT